MKPHDRPSTLDLTIVILSPLIVFVLTVIFLAGWWAQGAWNYLREVDE